MKTANLTTPKQGSYVHAKALGTGKRIGSTVYEVAVFMNQNAEQTIEEKLLRIVKNDLNLASQNGRIDLPQTGWLLERIS